MQKVSDMEVAGFADNGHRAMEMAAQERPDVVLLDLSMPSVNGLEATRQIGARLPATKILCLSMASDPASVAAALSAGASGYLLKECTQSELLHAIRTVHAKGGFLPPGLHSTVVEIIRLRKLGSAGSLLAALTSRERQTLLLIAEGFSTRQIAQRMNVSIKTIGSHREHLMEKLNIRSVAGLTKYAIREGLTTVDRLQVR